MINHIVFQLFNIFAGETIKEYTLFLNGSMIGNK